MNGSEIEGNANSEFPRPNAMPHDENRFNITFFGSGNVPKVALQEICRANIETFNRPIQNIYLVGRPETIEKRTLLARQEGQAQQSRKGRKISIVPANTESLDEILPKTDLFFFAADDNQKSEKSRVKMLRKNCNLVDEIQPYFNKDFKGIINFVSNLPEGLAHHAAATFDINDVRQITAGVPIDLLRYQWLVDKMLLQGQSYEYMDLVVVGHHDLPYPIINGSKVVTGYLKRTGEKDKPITVMIDKLLKNIESKNSLVKQIQECGLEEFNILERYLKSKGLALADSTESPTALPAGVAIKDFTAAVINRETTATAIPFKFEKDDNWFFVYLPVDFSKGFPKLDGERFRRLTLEDHRQLEDRIIGRSKVADKLALKSVLKKSLERKESYRFTVDTSDEALSTLNSLFNSKMSRGSAALYQDRMKQKPWKDMAEFNSLYDNVEEPLENLVRDLDVTSIDHLKKIADRRSILRDYVIHNQIHDEGIVQKMETLDSRLLELATRDIGEIGKKLFRVIGWTNVFNRLDSDEELCSTWKEYLNKWLKADFGSIERKNIENEPRYRRAAALQKEYHLLMGESELDIEDKIDLRAMLLDGQTDAADKVGNGNVPYLELIFENRAKIHEALSLYDQVVRKWRDIIKQKVLNMENISLLVKEYQDMYGARDQIIETLQDETGQLQDRNTALEDQLQKEVDNSTGMRQMLQQALDKTPQAIHIDMGAGTARRARRKKFNLSGFYMDRLEDYINNNEWTITITSNGQNEVEYKVNVPQERRDLAEKTLKVMAQYVLEKAVNANARDKMQITGRLDNEEIQFATGDPAKKYNPDQVFSRIVYLSKARDDKVNIHLDIIKNSEVNHHVR